MMDNNENENVNVYRVIDAEKTGDFIRKLRKERGMTQDDLGEKIFISRKSISKWETGICTPSIDMLKRLSEALGVSLEELVLGEFIEHKGKDKKKTKNEFIMKVLKNRWFRISSAGVLLIAIVLLVVLFISNLNANKVYLLSHIGDTFYITNGTITLSKENSCINVGGIHTELKEYSNDAKYKIDFYHKNDKNGEKLILSFENTLSASLDEESYRYLKRLFNKKDYDNLYFKFTFIGKSEKENTYNLNLKIVEKTSTGGEALKEPQKQSEDRTDTVDLSFLFDMNQEDIKKKYDKKKFKIDGAEWKTTYDDKGYILKIVSEDNKTVFITLTQPNFTLSSNDTYRSLIIEKGKINLNEVKKDELDLINQIVKKLTEL